MKTAGNKISIDLKDSPELAEYFSRKELGHKCRIEITFQLNHKDEEMVSGTIESYAPEGYEPDEENDEDTEDGMVMAKSDEPVMVVIKGKTRSSGY